MRVLTLTPSQTGYSPGQRGSIELWEKVLAPAGIELEYAPFETDRLRSVLYHPGNNATKIAEMLKGYASRLRLIKDLDNFDAVFIYREAALLGPAFLERLIAKKKPIIYQLDDPLYLPYKSNSNGYLSYLKFFGKIKEIIKLSTVVIVNSSHIRQYAEQFNKNIWQIPSLGDTGDYHFEPFPERLGRVCVGWSGSPSTVGNLKLVEKALQNLSKQDICDIHLIGSDDFGLADVRYTCQKWNGSTESADLRKMQIGLIPLPLNSWNPHKFIMKTAQYMVHGIVPVGTPMASNLEVIRHGKNGFLADNDDEWVEYISLLVNDHELRNRLSREAYKYAQEQFTLEANKAKIIGAFRAALNRT
jgi:glycosyltransferase involved in cell wall biosynthesis